MSEANEKMLRDRVEDVCARLVGTVTNNSIGRNMLSARNRGRGADPDIFFAEKHISVDAHSI